MAAYEVVVAAIIGREVAVSRANVSVVANPFEEKPFDPCAEAWKPVVCGQSCIEETPVRFGDLAAAIIYRKILGRNHYRPQKLDARA